MRLKIETFYVEEPKTSTENIKFRQTETRRDNGLPSQIFKRPEEKGGSSFSNRNRDT